MQFFVHITTRSSGEGWIGNFEGVSTELKDIELGRIGGWIRQANLWGRDWIGFSFEVTFFIWNGYQIGCNRVMITELYPLSLGYSLSR